MGKDKYRGIFEKARQGFYNFFGRLFREAVQNSSHYRQLESQTTRIARDLTRAEQQNQDYEYENKRLRTISQGTEAELKRTECRLRESHEAYLTAQVTADATGQAYDELEAQLYDANRRIVVLDPVRVGRLERTVEQRDALIGHLKEATHRYRREEKGAVIAARNNATQNCFGCISEGYLSKDISIFSDHRGIVVGQSPRAEKIYGDLSGKSLRQLISAENKGERKTVEEYFLSGQVEESWLYTNSYKREKPVPTKVRVHPFYVKVRYGGEDIKMLCGMHIKVLKTGKLWKVRDYILGGERCLQDRLRKDAERSEHAEQIAEQIRNGKLGLEGA